MNYRLNTSIFKKILKNNSIFILILLFALFLRFYRLDQLTTFGRDQGIDFLAVKNIIQDHNLTLLGIKTSIGDFYQGPHYRYLLLPAFYIFNFHPLAGAYTAIFLSSFSLICLYYFCLKYLGKTSAIFSSLLFTASPELVIFGNTPLYQNFLPLPLLLSLTFLILSLQTNRKIHLFILGILIGISMEIHFLTITFALSILIVLLLKIKFLPPISLYILGIVCGLIPTLIFELRNNFFNSQSVLIYLKTSSQNSSYLGHNFYSWIIGSAEFISGNNLIIGTIVLALTLSLLFLIKFKSNYLSNLKLFTFIYIIISLVISIKLSSFHNHYLLPLWLVLIIFIPTLLINHFKFLGYLLVCLLIIFNLKTSISLLNNDHGYDMPPGWNMNKILETSKIIIHDSKNQETYNVASLLDGDTRIYPLRYSLEYMGSKAEDVDKYPQSQHLYLVANQNINQVYQTQVWEIKSLEPYKITKIWNLGNNIILYRLDRQKV